MTETSNIIYLCCVQLGGRDGRPFKRERGHGLETGINNTQRYITIHIDAWRHSQNAKYQDE